MYSSCAPLPASRRLFKLKHFLIEAECVISITGVVNIYYGRLQSASATYDAITHMGVSSTASPQSEHTVLCIGDAVAKRTIMAYRVQKTTRANLLRHFGADAHPH